MADIVQKEMDELDRTFLDFIKPQEKDEMPYIPARMRLKQEGGYTYHLKQRSWQGLKKVIRDGEVAWEIDNNFTLIIHGRTGQCRIPDTEANRIRFERLSKPRKISVTRIQLDPEKGAVPVEEEVEEEPTFSRMDRSLLQDRVIDDMIPKLIEALKEKGFEIKHKGDKQKETPKQSKKPPPRPMPPARKIQEPIGQEARLMEAIKE